MNVGAISTLTETPKPTKIEGAAKQFEALMIAQMLRTARENTEEKDSSASTMLDVADQQFSQLLANNGGLGLAKLVVKGLTRSPTLTHGANNNDK